MLSRLIVRTEYQGLPQEAIKVSKEAILDTIGVALAGSGEDTGKINLEVLKELGGKAVSGVIGGKCRTSPVLAALANGTSAHALDYDDVSDSWIGHPSTVLVPALLAVAERNRSPGKGILTAYVTGFEVGARLGLVFGQDQYAKGWHTTGSIGCVAGAAAVAKLLNLDVKKTQMALGIAASLSGGLRENFGSMSKPLHAGSAASSAVLSGLLAERGFTSSENALTGKAGYGRVLGKDIDYDLASGLKDFGTPFDVVLRGIWVKAFPSGAVTHSSISAALKLRAEYSFKTQDITEITCATNRSVPNILIHHHPRSGLEGKFSMEYCVAAALIDGEVGIAQFTDKRALSSDIQSLLPRVKYIYPPELEDKFGFHVPGIVTVKLKNGMTLASRVESPKGRPENPMTPEEFKGKFESCSRSFLSKKEARDEVINLVLNLEKAPDIKRLMEVVIGA